MGKTLPWEQMFENLLGGANRLLYLFPFFPFENFHCHLLEPLVNVLFSTLLLPPMFFFLKASPLSKVSSSKDALGVPRGPCRMCHRCPGLPGFGLLRWPQLEEEVLEMGGNVPVGSKALAEMGSRCRRCDCPGHQHQNLEQWLGDVKKRCKEMRLIVSCWA